MSPARVVIGIDPGTALTGYGVIQENERGDLIRITHGVIRTKKDWEEPRRLLHLYQSLKSIIDEYRPDCVAVEKLFFQKNVKTAIKVGQGRGAALLAVAGYNLPLDEYSPSEIKLAVTGYGSADKKQIQTMVKMLLNMNELPKPDDAADALAVAICHLHTSRQKYLAQR